MATSKRRLTAAEFDGLRPFLHISEDRIDAARAGLVDGHSYPSIAAQYGWSRQAVNDAVTVVWKALDHYRAARKSSENATVLLPPGWEQVTLIAPSSLVSVFRAQIAVYAADASAVADVKNEKSKRSAAPRKRS